MTVLAPRNWSLRFGIAAAVALVAAAPAFAQPNPSLKPSYGSVTLKAGFLPDPYVKKLTAGGPVKTNLGGVNAYVATSPDFSLDYTKGGYPLTIHAIASADTTILVHLPNGTWLANDDGGKGTNPLLRINSPQSGRYHIWVGTYGKDTAPAALHITELTVNTGDTIAKSGGPKTNANWMRDLPDSRNLTAMSIPGTHDTCALYGGLFVQCQTMTVPEQLNNGVRFLDIRCRRAGDVFTIHHGPFYQKINFGEVQNHCIAFLDKNPSECIVMAIQEEHTAMDKSQPFSTIFKKYLSGREKHWYTATTVPNLGQARGKIVLMQKEGGIGGIAWDGFTVQNDWDVPTLFDIPKKWNKVKANLVAANRSPSKAFATFSSGTGVPGAAPRTVATSVNNQLEGFLRDTEPNHLGILIMDFPSQQLIDRVIQANFPYTTPINLTLRHQGGYVAKFRVTWKENGVSKSHDYGSRSLGWNDTLKLPRNATDVRVHAQAAVFIATWRDIHNGSVSVPGTYTASGTTGSRQWNRD